MASVENIQKTGVPIAMLQSAKGMQVTLEMSTNINERWVGTVVNVDDHGNVELANAKHWDGASPARDVISTIIRGSQILYVKLPVEEMTAIYPQLKLVQRAK